MSAASARVLRKKGEQGQALAETALFSVLAVIVIFGILALIPIHRTRTAAISAAATVPSASDGNTR